MRCMHLVTSQNSQIYLTLMVTWNFAEIIALLSTAWFIMIILLRHVAAVINPGFWNMEAGLAVWGQAPIGVRPRTEPLVIFRGKSLKNGTRGGSRSWNVCCQDPKMRTTNLPRILPLTYVFLNAVNYTLCTVVNPDDNITGWKSLRTHHSRCLCVQSDVRSTSH